MRIEGFNNLRRNSNGIVAVEMAFVLPIVIFLTFSIIEYSIIFYLSSRIESVANDAARLGVTGNLYGAATRKELIENKVEADLKKVIFHFDPKKLNVKVSSLSDYKITSHADTDPNDFGGSGDFTLYLITYDWNILTPLLSYGMQNRNGVFKITSRVIVKNEEF